jgi:hypothetical protein
MSDDITLTDADAQADLQGTPRPDNPTVQLIALPVVEMPASKLHDADAQGSAAA